MEIQMGINLISFVQRILYKCCNVYDLKEMLFLSKQWINYVYQSSQHKKTLHIFNISPHMCQADKCILGQH